MSVCVNNILWGSCGFSSTETGVYMLCCMRAPYKVAAVSHCSNDNTGKIPHFLTAQQLISSTPKDGQTFFSLVRFCPGEPRSILLPSPSFLTCDGDFFSSTLFLFLSSCLLLSFPLLCPLLFSSFLFSSSLVSSPPLPCSPLPSCCYAVSI